MRNIIIKKMLPSFLAIVMAITMLSTFALSSVALDVNLPMDPFPDKDTYVSGSCGTGLRWKLIFASGELTISGSGNMTDFEDASDVPWYNHRTSIKKVIIKRSVAGIGKYAFSDCSYLASVKFEGNRVTRIGEKAFYNCETLSGVTIPSSVTDIADHAFSNCSSLKTIVYCGTETQWNSILKGAEWANGSDYTLQYHNYSSCTCTECGYSKDHAWDDGTVTLKPTYTEVGVKTYTCNDCGTTKTEEIPMLVKLGDVTCDGEITNSDVLAIYRYIYNAEIYPVDINVGDVNKDGYVTNSDVLVIFRYIYNPELYPIE